MINKEDIIEELNEALEEFKKANGKKAEQENPYDVKERDWAYYGQGLNVIKERQKRNELAALLEKIAYENNITEYIIKENAKLKNEIEKLERENEEMRELLIKTILGD